MAELITAVVAAAKTAIGKELASRWLSLSVSTLALLTLIVGGYFVRPTSAAAHIAEIAGIPIATQLDHVHGWFIKPVRSGLISNLALTVMTVAYLTHMWISAWEPDRRNWKIRHWINESNWRAARTQRCAVSVLVSVAAYAEIHGATASFANPSRPPLLVGFLGTAKVLLGLLVVLLVGVVATLAANGLSPGESVEWPYTVKASLLDSGLFGLTLLFVILALPLWFFYRLTTGPWTPADNRSKKKSG